MPNRIDVNSDKYKLLTVIFNKDLYEDRIIYKQDMEEKT